MLADDHALSDQALCAYLFDADLDDEVARAEHAIELFNTLGCGPVRGAFLDRDVTLDRRVGAGKDPDEPYKELVLLSERAMLRVELSPKPYGEDPKWIPTYSNMNFVSLADNVVSWRWEMRFWSAPPANEHSRVRLTIELAHGEDQVLSAQRGECDALHALFHALIVPNLRASEARGR